jgi:hypothetical protein
MGSTFKVMANTLSLLHQQKKTYQNILREQEEPSTMCMYRAWKDIKCISVLSLNFYDYLIVVLEQLAEKQTLACPVQKEKRKKYYCTYKKMSNSHNNLKITMCSILQCVLNPGFLAGLLVVDINAPECIL